MHKAATATHGSSPLVAIKQKELELAAELALAQQAAEREIAAARQWVGAYLRQIERQAHEAAAIEIRAALESAGAEAANIRVEGERVAAAIMAAGTPRMAEAVEHIVTIVVPAVSQNDIAITNSPKAQVDHA